MPQSLAQVHIHVIFSTKKRMPFLVDAEIRQEMFAYLASVMKAYAVPRADCWRDGRSRPHSLCSLEDHHDCQSYRRSKAKFIQMDKNQGRVTSNYLNGKTVMALFL